MRRVIGFIFSTGSSEVDSELVDVFSLEVEASVGIDVEASSFVSVPRDVIYDDIVVKVVVPVIELVEVSEDNLVVVSEGVVSGVA